MPGGDGTGPAGMGPMTGGAAGYCAGYGMPGYLNPVGGRRGFWGRGFGGRGRGGGGFGWRNRFYATGLTGWQRAGMGWNPGWTGAWAGAAPTREQELEGLKDEASYFEQSLEEIKKRITELEQKTQSAAS